MKYKINIKAYLEYEVIDYGGYDEDEISIPDIEDYQSDLEFAIQQNLLANIEDTIKYTFDLSIYYENFTVDAHRGILDVEFEIGDNIADETYFTDRIVNDIIEGNAVDYYIEDAPVTIWDSEDESKSIESNVDIGVEVTFSDTQFDIEPIADY